jgi:acyl carrier protein phosphodiesterase
MNLLAHAVLSFHEPEILLGQMISDYVKGRQQFRYPPVVHQGILLHRLIDTFTDEHPVTREAKEIFRPQYRLYSGAFVDVSFDHFLAIDNAEFPNLSLDVFSRNVYSSLEQQKELMPAAFARMFPYMMRHNWLYGYSTREGMYQSFEGLVRRAAYMNDSRPAADLFDKNYATLEKFYKAFWPELKAFAVTEFKKILPATN